MDGRKGKQLATDGRFKGNWTKDGLSFLGAFGRLYCFWGREFVPAPCKDWPIGVRLA